MTDLPAGQWEEQGSWSCLADFGNVYLGGWRAKHALTGETLSKEFSFEVKQTFDQSLDERRAQLLDARTKADQGHLDWIAWLNYMETLK